MSAIVSSATASVSTSGVFAIEDVARACRFEIDVVDADAVVGDDAELRPGAVEQLAVYARRQQRQDSVDAVDAVGERERLHERLVHARRQLAGDVHRRRHASELRLTWSSCSRGFAVAPVTTNIRTSFCPVRNESSPASSEKRSLPPVPYECETAAIRPFSASASHCPTRRCGSVPTTGDGTSGDPFGRLRRSLLPTLSTIAWLSSCPVTFSPDTGLPTSPRNLPVPGELRPPRPGTEQRHLLPQPGLALREHLRVRSRDLADVHLRMVRRPAQHRDPGRLPRHVDAEDVGDRRQDVLRRDVRVDDARPAARRAAS